MWIPENDYSASEIKGLFLQAGGQDAVPVIRELLEALDAVGIKDLESVKRMARFSKDEVFVDRISQPQAIRLHAAIVAARQVLNG